MTALEIYALGAPIVALVVMASFGILSSRRDVAAYRSFSEQTASDRATRSAAFEEAAVMALNLSPDVRASVEAVIRSARRSGVSLFSLSSIARRDRQRTGADVLSNEIALSGERHTRDTRPSELTAYELALAAIEEAAALAQTSQLKVTPSDKPDALIVQSGVVEGVDYSIYSDGTIETKVSESVVRFASIDELRRLSDHQLEPPHLAQANITPRKLP